MGGDRDMRGGFLRGVARSMKAWLRVSGIYIKKCIKEIFMRLGEL